MQVSDFEFPGRPSISRAVPAPSSSILLTGTHLMDDSPAAAAVRSDVEEALVLRSRGGDQEHANHNEEDRTDNPHS